MGSAPGRPAPKTSDFEQQWGSCSRETYCDPLLKGLHVLTRPVTQCKSSSLKSTQTIGKLFATSAGEVGACCDPLWGRRSWQVPLLHSPSNLLASVGISHSPRHFPIPNQCLPRDWSFPLPLLQNLPKLVGMQMTHRGHPLSIWLLWTGMIVFLGPAQV